MLLSSWQQQRELEAGSCYVKYHDIKREPVGVPSIKAECLTTVMAHCSTSVTGLSWLPFFFAFDLLNPVIPVCFANRVPSPADSEIRCLVTLPQLFTLQLAHVNTSEVYYGSVILHLSSAQPSDSCSLPAPGLLKEFLTILLCFCFPDAFLLIFFLMFYQNLATSLNTGRSERHTNLGSEKHTQSPPHLHPHSLPSHKNRAWSLKL